MTFRYTMEEGPPHPLCKWLPEKVEDLNAYLKEFFRRVYKTDRVTPDNIERLDEKMIGGDFVPPVQALSDLIETEAKYNMYFHQMFYQVPHKYKKTMYVKNYHVFLRALNFILTNAPIYTQHHVGCPINAILTWPMGTVAGYSAFLDDKLNVYLKDILTSWTLFLQSEDSAKHLDTTPGIGWFCDDAMGKMELAGGEPFDVMYKCNPKKT